MDAKTIQIHTRDGRVPCYLAAPSADAAVPAVIIYMDAFGVRPALCGMVERLAAAGYRVLLPDLYYRAGPQPAFDPATAFQEGPQRDRVMGLYKSLNQKLVMADTASFLEFLASQPGGEKKVGCVGYCMGGAYALSASGTFPDRIAAAASFHGARLATDQPDSPHLLVPRMRGGIYVGIAGLDTHFSPEEKARLKNALRTAGVRHTVEVYEGAKHGFAVTDTPAYDKAASDRHFEQVLKLFEKELAA